MKNNIELYIMSTQTNKSPRKSNSLTRKSNSLTRKSNSLLSRRKNNKSPRSTSKAATSKAATSKAATSKPDKYTKSSTIKYGSRQVFIDKYSLDLSDHKMNYKEYNSYSQEIKDILNGKKVNLCHIKDGAEKSQDDINRILNMNDQLDYYLRTNIFKRALHWGQLKLFLSELEFLTKILLEKPNKKIVFVYAGAAPGHHIKFLHDMFKEIDFELYDPNKFVINDEPGLKTHVQFFMDEDAQYWHDKAKKENLYLAFCSDIRTEPATSENVIRNMNMQLGWWKIMNPDLSMFKFRLPWEAGKTTYPEGDIYLQAFPGPTSTETRLMVRKNAKIIQYDNKAYESACFHHNIINRELYYDNILGDLSLEKDGLDNCYDCVSFIKIVEEYNKFRSLPISNIKTLINSIQKEITGDTDIYNNTVKYFNDTLGNFKKNAYYACNNRKCRSCPNGIRYINPIEKGYSVATIANEEAAKKERYDKK
jgi:hypothetical protein